MEDSNGSRCLLLFLIIGALSACSDALTASDAARPADGAGAWDASAQPDASAGLDALPLADAAAQADGGLEVDSGVLADATSIVDSGEGIDVPTGPTCGRHCYAAVSGNDLNPGTLAEPLGTIQRCAQEVSAAGGGTCTVRGGTYEETVKVGSDVVVEAYGGATPEEAVISGADRLNLTWAQHGPNIWKASVDLDTGAQRWVAEDVQVFRDGTPLIEARWPNIGGFTSLLNQGGGVERTAGPGSGMADGIHGTITDTGIQAGIDGAIIHVRGGLKWGAHTGTIDRATASSLSYTVDNGAPGSPAPIAEAVRTAPGSNYFVTRSLALLDGPDEIFYDRAQKVLYIFSQGSPSGHVFSAKMREWALNLSGATRAQVRNLQIFAATVLMDLASSNNVLFGLTARYVSHFVRNQYGPLAGWSESSGIRLFGTDNTIESSTIEYAAGNGISIKGNGHKVLGNTIRFTDYAGTYNAFVFIAPDRNGFVNRIQILGNRMSDTGRDGIAYYANDGALQDSRIAYNDISGFSRLAVDDGGIYVCCDVDGATWAGGQVVGRTSIDHNRIHDGFEGTTAGVMFDNRTHGFVTAHNVLWNNKGSGVILNGYLDGGGPGHSYDHTINNNTFWGGQEHSVFAGGQAAGGLAGTFISNNIFVTPPNVRQGCAGGLCIGSSSFGEGGFANYYGNPGFVNGTVPPYDFNLYGGAANSCANIATPVWTDSNGVQDLCPSGTSCAQPVSPSMGAYNVGGFNWTVGTTRP